MIRSALFLLFLACTYSSFAQPDVRPQSELEDPGTADTTDRSVPEITPDSSYSFSGFAILSFFGLILIVWPAIISLLLAYQKNQYVMLWLLLGIVPVVNIVTTIYLASISAPHANPPTPWEDRI
jgi:hypothetical protein